MAEPWQKPLILANRQDVRQILDEIEKADDLDLWNEVAAKLSDVIIVYRRSQQSEPTHFTFSDGVARNLTAMAASHAACQVSDEIDLDADDEFPAFMMRGEKGA